jgi:hypothetical protein
MYAQMNALLELGMNLEWSKLESQEEKKCFFFIALQQKLPIVQPIARTEQFPCL